MAGWLVGGFGAIESKTNSADLELGLSLATTRTVASKSAKQNPNMNETILTTNTTTKEPLNN